MTTHNFKHYLLILLLFVISASSAFTESVSRQSLGLDGCKVNSIASNSAGTFVVAGCEEVLGNYYSVDSGATWKLTAASQGLNSATRYIVTAQDSAYAIIGNSVVTAPLPKLPSSTTEWNPTWQFTDIGVFTNSLTASDNFVLAAISQRISNDSNNPDFNNYISSIKVLNATTNSLVTTAVLPTAVDESVTWVAISAGYVYAIAPTRLYKATFNSSTGAIGSWSDISSNSGLPGSGYTRVFTVPGTSKVYVITTSGTLFLSTDDAVTFSSVSLPSVLDINKTRASFLNSTYLMGAKLSLDSGSNWMDLSSNSISGNPNVKIQDGAVFLGPINPESALISTQVGLAITSNLFSNGGSPDWSNASTGLLGVQSLALSRDSSSADNAILGTPTGLALTKTFVADLPAWNFPICPSGGCKSYKSVEFDGSDSSIAYAVGDFGLTKLSVDFTATPPSLTFSDFGPDGLSTDFVKSYSALSASIVVNDRSNGGLVFISKADGSVQSTALIGKTVSNFIALDANVMFAGIGFQSAAPDAADRGIYRSTDGGANWSEMTDDDLSTLVFPSNFTYDTQRDILYMSTFSDFYETSFTPALPKGSVYTLLGAGAGATDWKEPAAAIATSSNFAITAIAVEVSSGEVFASGIGRIFSSTDSGDKFELIFTTSPLEDIYFLRPRELAGLFSAAVSVQSSSLLNVLAGTTTGFYKFETGGGAAASCSLTTSIKCSKANGVTAGKKCTLRASVVNSSTQAPLKNKKLAFQSREKGQKSWTVLDADTTNSNGASTLKVTIDRTTSFRLKVKSPACTSSTLKIKKR